LIRRTVINLLPMLARFNPEQFCERYLTDSINHLIMILRKGSERSSPYLALGAIVSIAGQRARPWLDDIVELIDDGIVPKSRKPHCYEAVTCLASVAEALPDDPTLLVRAPMLLEQMFSGTGGRLDPRMVSAISDVARSMPSLLPDIQLRLLDAVSFILQMTPYQPSGTPKNRRIAPFRSQTIGPGDDTFERHQAVIQALQALCRLWAALNLKKHLCENRAIANAPLPESWPLNNMNPKICRFDFAGAHLLEFVRDCVSVYLDDPSPVVRMEAAQTCIKFLLPPGEPLPKRGAAAGLICQVIEKLLAVSVGDPDGQIRLGVLNLFDARFDYFLSQAETIALLFVALNDEIFVVREASIQIVARLTLRNPAHVMPTLRKMLVQVIYTSRTFFHCCKARVECSGYGPGIRIGHFSTAENSSCLRCPFRSPPTYFLRTSYSGS
jgi:FKBP12-rapamycin complex-associated protein